MKDSFYVTLISTSSQKTHPSNTPSNFRTKLGRRITFIEDYEVALSEFHYPNTLCNAYGRSATTWIYEGRNMLRSILPQTYYQNINQMLSMINNDLENKINLSVVFQITILHLIF